MRAASIAATAGYAVLLLGIGTADAILTRDVNILPVLPAEDDTTTGVPRPAGPELAEIWEDLSITTGETGENSILQSIVTPETEVQSQALLKNNDRLAYFSWVETPEAKIYFTALKQALSSSFSSELQDLVDETQERPGKPVRNVLSFLDPAIHEERILFVRVRQRLYEFHVAEGREAEVQGVMDALTE
jgi:hypothetical protein